MGKLSILRLKVLNWNFKTGTQKEFYLGVIALSLEGIPQLWILGATMTHWHGDFDTTALDFYGVYVNIPLCVWYLSFYCSPSTKFAVICKILVLAFDNSSHCWNDYIERYIHTEEEIEDSAMEFEIESKKFYEYDNSNFFNMAMYQIGYIILAPFIGKLCWWTN